MPKAHDIFISQKYISIISKQSTSTFVFSLQSGKKSQQKEAHLKARLTLM